MAKSYDGMEIMNLIDSVLVKIDAKIYGVETVRGLQYTILDHSVIGHG